MAIFTKDISAIVLIIVTGTTAWIAWLYGIFQSSNGYLGDIDAGSYVDRFGQRHTYLPKVRKRRTISAFGVFIALSGIILGVIVPWYLSLTTLEAILLRFLAIALACGVGVSLTFIYLVGNLSLAFGFLAASIILHSQIINLESIYGELIALRLLVIIYLFVTSWFIGRGIFFRLPSVKRPTRNEDWGYYLLAGIGALITLMEFTNIIYDLYVLSQ